MRKIEEGCRAKIINLEDASSRYNGTIVMVRKYEGLTDQGNPHWSVDKTFNHENQETALVVESCLQRIDDDDVELGRWEELKEIWQPPLETVT